MNELANTNLNYDTLTAYIDGLYADGTLSPEDYQKIINYIYANGELSSTARDLIQIRRGMQADLPQLAQGELGFTLDAENLYIGGLGGNVNLFNPNITAGSPMSYGAKGDGVTDDTIPIMNAIKAHKVIDGSFKTYKVTATLQIPDDTIFKNFNLSASFTPALYDIGVVSIVGSNAAIMNVNIDGNNNRLSGATFIGANTSLISNLSVVNCQGAGVYFRDQTQNCMLVQSTVSNCGQFFKGGMIQAQQQSNNNLIFQCTVSNCDSKGFVSYQSTYTHFKNCTAINLDAESFYPSYQSSHTYFTDCYSFRDLADPSGSSVKCSRGCDNIFFKGCKIVHNNGSNNNVSCFTVQGGTNVKVEDCYLSSNVNQVVNLTQHPGDPNNQTPAANSYNIEFSNCVIDAIQGITCVRGTPITDFKTIDGVKFLNCRFQNYNRAIYLTDFSNVLIDGCEFLPTTFTTENSQVIMLAANSTTADYAVNSIITNCFFPACSQYAINHLRIKQFIVSNCVFVSTGTQRLVGLNNCYNGSVNNCIFVNFTRALIADTVSNNCSFTGNIFIPSTTGDSEALRLNGTNYTVSGNSFTTTTNPMLPQGGGTGTNVDFNNIRRRMLGSAAPTTGTWSQGAIVYNQSPTAGGVIGWVCVAAGTPGTWQGFGTISS